MLAWNEGVLLRGSRLQGKDGADRGHIAGRTRQNSISELIFRGYCIGLDLREVEFGQLRDCGRLQRVHNIFMARLESIRMADAFLYEVLSRRIQLILSHLAPFRIAVSELGETVGNREANSLALCQVDCARTRAGAYDSSAIVHLPALPENAL
jgi:hypothetical protein